MAGGPNDPQGPGDEPVDDEPDDLDLEVDGDAEDEEPEPEEVASEPEPRAEPPRLTRRQRQEANWRERARQAEVERDFYRSQTQQAPRPQVDQQQLQQQRQQEYDRIAMLPPNEQVAALHQLMQRENALTQLQMFDHNDRRDFEALQAQFPEARPFATQVEQILQQQRAQGIYQFSRSQIFDALWGNEDRTQRMRGQQRRARNGEARVARQTVRPTGRRGDVGGGARRGRSQEDADIALLRGARLDEM